MIDAHDTLLERYFWDFVDRGNARRNTPLFAGDFSGESLTHIIAKEFGLSLHEAEAAIEIARQEVAL
ncbi:MAG TPA: hypothetical protein VIT23_14925 [Terrimicrobiaceae bacterium]